MGRSKNNRPRRVPALVVAGLVGAAALIPATSAEAALPVAITCGAVLHQNGYLPANLTCPDGDGVTVDADISIDLQGHYLKGPGNGNGAGVTVNYPANLKISHGRLTGWGVGLTLVAPLAAPSPVKKQSTMIIAVTLLSNGTGVNAGPILFRGAPVPKLTIYRSWFVDNTFGLAGNGGNTAVTVSGGAFEHNDTGVFEAAFGASNRLHLSDTTFTANRYGLICQTAICTVSNNTFADNPVGVQSEKTETLLTLTGNTMTGSTQGAANIDDAANAVVTGNTISRSSVGINFSNSSGSITNNVLTDNGQGMQLEVPLDRSIYPLAQVTGNRVAGSAGQGIDLADGSGAAIGGNTVVDNGSYGIYAPGAVDLGSNHASGNKMTPQCVGVICTSGP